MKIAIIGVPSRQEKEASLVNEAKKMFDVVEYVPVNQLRLGIGKQITLKFDNIELNDFDCILIIPTPYYKEFFYTLCKMSNCPTSFEPEKFLLMYNEALLSNFLNKNGVKTRQFITIPSNMSFQKISLIKFPVIVRLASKKVLVTNKNTLRDVISLFRTGDPMTIERPVKAEKIMWLFVLNNEVISSYQEIGKDRKVVKRIDKELKETALKVNKLLNLEYSLMRFVLFKEKWLFDRITLSPDFRKIENITGENISRLIVDRMKQKCEHRRKLPLLQRILDLVRI